MTSEIIVAIISGVFTVIGIYVSHYLSERRAIRLRGVQKHGDVFNKHETVRETTKLKKEDIENKVIVSESVTPKQYLTGFIMLLIAGVAWGGAFAAVATVGGGDSTGVWSLIIFEPILAFYTFLCFKKYHHYFSTLIGLGALLLNLFVIFEILA